MDNFFKSLAPIAEPVSRLLMSLIFIIAGFNKIGGYAGTAAYMESQGVPGALLPLVIILELGGGLMFLVGWQARLVAFLLAGLSILAGIIFHFMPAQSLEGAAAQQQMIHFMKNLAIAGGLGFVMAHGAGAFSIDNRRSTSE